MHVPRKRPLTLMLVLVCLLAVGLAWGIVGALAASESPATAPTAAAGDTTLRIGWAATPDNLNPFIGWSDTSYEIWSLNYSFLFGFGLNEKPIPDLAAEIPTKDNGGLSADEKVWTVKLKPNIKWQDGKPFTAEDVAFTYNFIVQKQIYTMMVSTDGIKSAKALDPLTVQVTCSRPKADFLRMWVPILPEHIWKDVSGWAAQNSYQNKPPIIGTGPFQVVEYKANRYVRMVRNDDYFGKKPVVSEIIFETYQNADSMFQDLKKGNLDAAQGIPEAVFRTIPSDGDLKPVAYTYYNWDYLNINCCPTVSGGNPVLRDPAFRLALNYAIDHNKLCQTGHGGRAIPGTTIMTPGSWTNPDYHWEPPADVKYTFDLEKAKSLLDAAGYKDSNGDGVREDKNGKPIELGLIATSNNPEEQLEAKLIADWFTQIGLKIKFSVMDGGRLDDKIWAWDNAACLYAPDFDLYIWDWAGYNDPGQTLWCYTSQQAQGGWNEPYWENKEFDKLCVQQGETLDPEARKQIVWQMQELMYKDTPQIVLTYPQYLQAYNTKKWDGWTQTQNGKGPAFMTTYVIDSYLNLKPSTGGGAEEGKSRTGLYVGIVVAIAVVVIVLIVVLVMRRGGKVEEA
jgi:peptide/nickel transport system substrate-binding protein